jgi:hypothetical protein
MVKVLLHHLEWFSSYSNSCLYSFCTSRLCERLHRLGYTWSQISLFGEMILGKTVVGCLLQVALESLKVLALQVSLFYLGECLYLRGRLGA